MTTVDLTNFLPVLGTLLGTGGVGVVVVMWIFKKVSKMKAKVSEAEADHALHLVAVSLSFIGAAAQYVLQLKGKVPVDFLGLSFATVYGASQFVFKESQTLDKLLKQHYGEIESALVDPAKSVASAAEKVVADPGDVMNGVETVAKDAKAVEAEFAA